MASESKASEHCDMEKSKVHEKHRKNTMKNAVKYNILQRKTTYLVKSEQALYLTHIRFSLLLLLFFIPAFYTHRS